MKTAYFLIMFHFYSQGNSGVAYMNFKETYQSQKYLFKDKEYLKKSLEDLLKWKKSTIQVDSIIEVDFNTGISYTNNFHTKIEWQR